MVADLADLGHRPRAGRVPPPAVTRPAEAAAAPAEPGAAPAVADRPAPARPIRPTARDVLRMQRSAGNAAAATLLSSRNRRPTRPPSPTVQRLADPKTSSGAASTSAGPTTAGPTASGPTGAGPTTGPTGAGATTGPTGGGPEAGGPGRPAAGPDAAGAPGPGGSPDPAGGGAPRLEGPVAFLTALDGARPSEFPARLGAARAAAVPALETSRTDPGLEATAAPTGLEPGPPAPPPVPPEVSPGPVQEPTRPAVPAGATVLEPTGATDPGQADEWARAGSAALEASGAGTAAPAPVAGALRPTESASPLTPLAIPPAPALPPAPTAAGVAADVAGALDLNMAGTVTAMAAGLLAPAGRAGTAYAAETAAARSTTSSGIASIGAQTAAEQQRTAADADLRVADLHLQWGTQRSAIVAEHRSAIQAESGRTRAEATRTIDEANEQAKARAEEAERDQPQAEQQSSGWWGKIKSAGRAVAGAVRGVAGAVLSVVANLFAAARQQVIGLISRLAAAVRSRIDAAVRAVAQAASRAWSAMGAVVRGAQAAIARLAARAADLARRLWAAAKARVSAAWDALTRAVAAAVNAAKAVVAKIAAAAGTLQEILKILRSGALEKLFQAAKDPQRLVQPVVDKAAPLVGQVPGKADELTREQGAKAGTPPPAGPAVQRLTVQRDGPAQDRSIGDQAGELILEGHIRQSDPEIPPAPAGEGFWGGVWRHMKATGNHFLANWQTTLINLVYALLLFYPVLLQEGPKLWEECKGVIFGGGGVDRFDHVLGVLRRLVNIVAGLVATAGIWALIIGAFTGPGEVFVAGAYETISLGVIAADVTLGLAEMGKSWYSATREGIAVPTRERYLGMFSGSVIATAITIILVILGAIASKLAKAFKTRGAAAEVGEGAKGGKPAGEGGGKGPAEDRPGDGGGERPSGGDPSLGGQSHGIGDSNPARARELVNEEAAKGAKPEEAAGHEVWKTREGCVVCSNPCDFMGGKFRDKFAAGTPEAADFTRRFHQIEAMPDGPAKVTAEKTLVTDLENAPAPVPTPPGTPGRLTVEPGVTLSPSERAAAEFWANQGKATTAVKPSTAEGVRTADLNVEGIGRVDVYAPEASTSANRVVGAILSKGSQTSMVHVELSPTSVVTPAEVARFPGRIFGHPTAGKGITRILVRQNGVVLLDSTRR